MDHFQASLNTIHRSLSTLGEQVLELEQRVCSTKDNISDLENHVIFYLKEKVLPENQSLLIFVSYMSLNKLRAGHSGLHETADPTSPW